MSMNKEFAPAIRLLFLVCTVAGILDAATLTVSKDGRGAYASIQTAVSAAHPGDAVTIIDTATYTEQVTIDSTKSGLTLVSSNPNSLTKPKIVWMDSIHVGPKSSAEAKIDSCINFHYNGALRIINCPNVTIDGITIDGGGWFVFGYNGVWASGADNQFGNVAITICQSRGVLIRNCDITHAFIGMYVWDYNQGGIFAVDNPSDTTIKVLPFSKFSMMGNHVIEYNRIHDNSFGMYFEQMYDLGTTIRYNLIYENHHYSDAFASKVKTKTQSEGANEPGGAMIFKDNMLSPLAIYNNTFWHNFLLFIGHWEPGCQHEVFNNICAKPNRY